MKSKKTATNSLRADNAGPALNRGLAGVVFFMLFLATRLPACDMSAFVQSEFAERCQLLLELCEKADLARTLDHPDIKAYNGALSREWVRFFLAHGKHVSIPPTLTFIASDSWSVAMNEIGNAIAGLINTGLDREKLNLLRFRISLLKEPQRIEEVQKVLAGRREFLAVKKDDQNKTVWLEQSLILPARTVLGQIGEAPELLHQLETDVDSHIEAFRRIIEYEKDDTNQEVVAALFTSLQQEIELDMAFWERLFFYNT